MKFWTLPVVALLSMGGWSQVYEFESLIDLGCTDVKSQDKTGTCWSYSTTSFLESEFIRMGKGQHDISEMYSVRMVYPQKAVNYVRYHGKTQFGQGSLSHDVINVTEEFGLVPESVYSGKNNGEDIHDHSELVSMLQSSLDVVLKSSKVSSTWIKAYNSLLDAYLGEVPEKFTYKGKEYTPQSFAEHLGFDASNYVSITSFTHHPFYEDFILEVPDNFSKGSFKNLPLDEYVQVIDYALENGFSLSLDADVSESYFSSKEGMAIMPDGKAKDYEKKLFKEVLPEMKVNQAKRQEGFEDHTTTDDHLMHIVGKLKDQNGHIYYKVKNSWGDHRGNGGYIYMSVDYLKMKSISVMLHKDGIPKDIAKKLSL